MAQGLDDALAQLRDVSTRLAAARSTVAGLEPEQVRGLREAKAAGASEAQLQEASGLSRVTVWKRLKD